MTSNIFLFLTTLLAPLYVIRFKLGPLPTTLLEVLIGLTVLSFLIERLIARDSLTRWKRRLISPFTYPALALIFIGLVSVAVSPDHYQALGLWRAYILEPVLIYSVLLSKLLEQKYARTFLVAWFGSALWISGLALFQKVQVATTSHLARDPRFGRPFAVFNSPNDVALFIGPLAALSITLFRLHKVLILVTLVLFAGVWVSGSRGGELALGSVEVLLVLAWVFRKLSPPWRRISLQVVAFLAAVLLAALVHFFVDLGNFNPPPKDQYQRAYLDTTVVRLCLWQGTRNMLLDHPIFGVGLDGFHSAYPKYHTCNSEDLQYPHNIFLNIWSELGLAGLIVFAWIYFVAFREIVRSRGHWIVKTAFLGALFYSVIHGLVDVPFFKNDLALEFWLLLAAIAAFRQNKLLGK